jgi:hypothetical protein
MQGCVHDYPAIVAEPNDFAVASVRVPTLSNVAAKATRVRKNEGFQMLLPKLTSEALRSLSSQRACVVRSPLALTLVLHWFSTRTPLALTLILALALAQYGSGLFIPSGSPRG